MTCSHANNNSAAAELCNFAIHACQRAVSVEASMAALVEGINLPLEVMSMSLPQNVFEI